jgi:hypothetical protein
MVIHLTALEVGHLIPAVLEVGLFITHNCILVTFSISRSRCTLSAAAAAIASEERMLAAGDSTRVKLRSSHH